MPVDTSPAATGHIQRLVSGVLGAGAQGVLGALVIASALAEERGGRVSRAAAAMALNVLLLADVLARVPAAAQYVAAAGRVLFDHGALRTIAGPTGGLPSGHAAFARILEPLGYSRVGEYPLPRLMMHGAAFAQADHSEAIPQFFVSALDVALLPPDAQAAAVRVFGGSVDPLGVVENALLAAMAAQGAADYALVEAGLPGLARAFGRHHPEPALADYEGLLAASAEAAWIATEGNAFNHATDRVPDVAALAERLRGDGYAIKDAVEISASGRVRQTALIAAKVERGFVGHNGLRVMREVPGSFHEFISRDVDPATGALDLRFDSGNATGIFAVTRAA